MATPEQSVTERVERPAQPPGNSEPAPKLTFEAKNVSIWYGEKRAIEDVSLNIASNASHARADAKNSDGRHGPSAR